jgi:hypothetical protein
MDAISWVAGGLLLATAAAGDDHAASVTTKVVTHVVKDGHVVKDSKLSTDDLKRLGVDLSGLDALIADVVKRAVDDVEAGRVPDAAAIQRNLTLNGVPVQAHVEVKTGPEALDEFEQRFPELKREIDELTRSFGDPPRGRVGHEPHEPREPREPTPTTKPAPTPATNPAAKPATKPAAKPVARPTAKKAKELPVKPPSRSVAPELPAPLLPPLRDSD